MTKKKIHSMNNPFKHLVLDAEEKEIEASLDRDDWKSVKNFAKRKKEMEIVAKNTLQLRKSKKITFRINEGDLIQLKARAKKKNIPYQTLLTALIRGYIDGGYSVRL